MALYDYRCECGKTKTEVVSINAEAKAIKCKCGKEMKRVYSAPLLSFKGTGWGKD